MRELVLVLILANLGFLAWRIWIAPPEAPPAASEEPRNVQRLVLVSELAREGEETAQEGDGAPRAADTAEIADGATAQSEPEETEVAAEQDEGGRALAAAVAEPATATATEGPGGAELPAAAQTTGDGGLIVRAAMRCVSLGPYVELSVAAEAAAALRARGLAPEQRPGESRIWVGHWVHLEPYPTRAEAIATVEAMRAEGIEDLYIEPGGENANAVSLGLFNDRERAELRAGNIRRMGYRPVIGDRYRDASVYWIDFELAQGEDFAIADLPSPPGPGLRLEERACEGGEEAGEAAGEGQASAQGVEAKMAAAHLVLHESGPGCLQLNGLRRVHRMSGGARRATIPGELA